MKIRRLLSLLLCSIVLGSCSGVNPGDQSGMSVFPLHSRGSGNVGDPMPYYEDGKMYVYYLEDARNYGGGGFHPISLLETNDFTHYEDKGIMLDFVNDRYSIEFALATGSVIKDPDGLYHFFYGGYNADKSFTGMPYIQTILHATSHDLYNWEKDPTFNGTGYMIGTGDDFRDPYVLWVEEYQEYWMLITSREGGSANTLKYTSKDLLNWTKAGSFFKSTVYNNMECPSLIHWNGYWYYSFSENGNHGYTKFLAKKNLSDPNWIDIPTIDGFYAGRPVIGQDNRLFMYGWAPTKGLYDSVEPDWAGNLIMSEFIQKGNEPRLYPIMPKEYKDEFKDEVTYKAVFSGKAVSNLSFDKTTYVNATAIEQIKKDKITRFEFDFKADEKVGRTGITFANNSDLQLGSIAFDFNFDRNQFLFFNNCANNNFNAMEYCVDFQFAANTNYHVDVITEDSVTSVYLNDTVALTMRTTSILRNNWAFYAQNVGVDYSNINFYE